jgi:aspartyl-tRNA(Asn)/glutamyl-tRNA(Gln) amidotransferase subunit B
MARQWVKEIQAGMPELPEVRRCRFGAQYNLGDYDADLLTGERAVAEYFEQAAIAGEAKGISAKTIAHWITGDLFHLLNLANAGIATAKVSPRQLVDLLALVGENVINTTTGRRVLEVMFATGRPAHDIVAEEGLARIGDKHALSAVAEQVLRENPAAVAQYKQGKETVLRFLVGQVMRATKGNADPNCAKEILKEHLSRAS